MGKTGRTKNNAFNNEKKSSSKIKEFDFSDTQKRFSAHEASAQLGVKKFHKEAGRLDVITQREIEEAKFMDPDTGLLKESLAIPRNCPLCSKNEYEVSFLKQGFSYCRCQHCQMLYVNPLLNNEVNNEKYSDGNFEDQSLSQYLNPMSRN